MPRRRDGSVEHATQGLSINVTRLNTEPDDPTGKLINNNEYPVGPECGGLAAEQVHTPKAIFGVTDEGKPGWSAMTWIRPVVLCQYASDNVFTELNIKGQ